MQRWPIGRHPGRGHRPGHPRCPLPSAAADQHQNRRSARPLMRPWRHPRPQMPPVTPRPVNVEGGCGRPPAAQTAGVPGYRAPVRCAAPGGVRSPGRHQAFPFRLLRPFPVCSARRIAAQEGQAGGGTAYRPSDQSRPAGVGCGDQRIRLDPAREAEHRYPPPRTAICPTGGSPVPRCPTTPGTRWGMPAAITRAPSATRSMGWAR